MSDLQSLSQHSSKPAMVRRGRLVYVRFSQPQVLDKRLTEELRVVKESYSPVRRIEDLWLTFSLSRPMVNSFVIEDLWLTFLLSKTYGERSGYRRPMVVILAIEGLWLTL